MLRGAVLFRGQTLYFCVDKHTEFYKRKRKKTVNDIMKALIEFESDELREFIEDTKGYLSVYSEAIKTLEDKLTPDEFEKILV